MTSARPPAPETARTRQLITELAALGDDDAAVAYLRLQYATMTAAAWARLTDRLTPVPEPTDQELWMLDCDNRGV